MDNEMFHQDAIVIKSYAKDFRKIKKILKDFKVIKSPTKIEYAKVINDIMSIIYG